MRKNKKRPKQKRDRYTQSELAFIDLTKKYMDEILKEIYRRAADPDTEWISTQNPKKKQ